MHFSSKKTKFSPHCYARCSSTGYPVFYAGGCFSVYCETYSSSSRLTPHVGLCPPLDTPKSNIENRGLWTVGYEYVDCYGGQIGVFRAFFVVDMRQECIFRKEIQCPCNVVGRLRRASSKNTTLQTLLTYNT